MNWSSLVFTLLTVATLVCGGYRQCFSEVPHLRETPQKLKSGPWVVMGSSTAAGAGVSRGKSWVDLLQPDSLRYGGQITNITRGGSVTYQGLSTAAAPVQGRATPDPEINIDKALSLDPALVILAYPSNDTALGYSVEETVRNLLAMRDLALEKSTAVMMLSTQPRKLSDLQLARLALIDEFLAAGVSPCFVEVHSALAADNGWLAVQYDAGDGVHLNDAGHFLIAAKIREVLNSGKCVEPPFPKKIAAPPVPSDAHKVLDGASYDSGVRND